MKSREHNSLPEDILSEFQNGTTDSRQKALRVWELLEEGVVHSRVFVYIVFKVWWM